MQKQPIYNVGLYARLSREDEREGDSASIENQRDILMKHVREQGWSLVDVYIDDGCSGGNFNRPGFQRLIADVKSGRVNLVLVKDLSRLGRNYIEAGQYTEYLFPMHRCRFVALHDGVDSSRGDNDIMPFKNLFNEFYLRDCSKKAKASKKAMAERGRYIGSYAPYGYAMAADDTHRLVIDEQAAPVVRRIFGLRRQGYGPRRIAGLLNEEHIPPPSAYRKVHTGQQILGPKPPAWNCTTISAMLSNEAYIGNLVQRKEETLSYKSKHRLQVPEEEWVRRENTHEPIVDRQTWEACARMAARAQQTRSGRGGQPHLFAGLLVCEDCGCGLRVNIDRRSSGGSCVRYVCGRYQTGGKAACSIHSIREDVLCQIVREDLQRFLPEKHDDEALRQLVCKRLQKSAAEQHRAERTKAEQLHSRLAELAQITCSLYEDKALGRISRQSYLEMLERYRGEQEAKSEELHALKHKLSAMEQSQDAVAGLVAAVKRHACAEELNRAMLLELIDRIVIGEKQVADGQKTQRVEIFYNFAGPMPDRSL